MQKWVLMSMRNREEYFSSIALQAKNTQIFKRFHLIIKINY